MTPARQAQIWILILVAAVILLWLLRAILLPFVAGIAVAYLLDPVADFLERRGLPRLAAVIVITLIFLLILVGAVVLVVPLVWAQVMAFMDAWPRILERARAFMEALRAGQMDRMPAGGGFVNDTVEGLRNSITQSLSGIASGLLKQGLDIVNLVSLLFVTPVVTFYMLLDWDLITERIDHHLPRQHAPTIRHLAREADRVLSGFARGTAIVCALLAAFYGLALTLIGLKFGLIVGLIAGALSFIPFVGSITGFVLAGGLAVLQYWPDPLMIGLVVAIFVIGQVIEGNFITPRLVGDSVGLHPVWVVFALLSFGALSGFVGLLLAVPIAAVIGVLVRHAVGIYLGSRLYQGHVPADREGEKVTAAMPQASPPMPPPAA